MSGTTRTIPGAQIKSTATDPHAHLEALLSGPVVNITGARACTTYGERVTQDIAALVAMAGATVITGGSYGVDTMAIRGALTGGGKVVVVLASGLDRIYPAPNADLFDAVVAQGGAIVSTYPDDAVPNRTQFLERGQLMAEVADIVIIPEAATRSAALRSIRAVGDVPVFAVPGPVTSMTSAGPHQLIREGRAQLITPDPEDVRAALASISTQGAPQA